MEPLTLIVIDSVAALVPKTELEGEIDVHGGLQARLMSQALRKLTAHISKIQSSMYIYKSDKGKGWSNIR